MTRCPPPASPGATARQHADVSGNPWSSTTGRPSAGPAVYARKVMPRASRANGCTTARLRKADPQARCPRPRVRSMPDDGVRSYVAEHADEFVAALVDWLRIPSIGADPEH